MGSTLEQDGREDLTVMHRRIRDRILANQFVLLVDVHMILIPIVTGPMLLRPARLRIFLPAFGGVFLPLGRALPGFDGGVVRAGVPLYRDGNERGINQLAPTRL